MPNVITPAQLIEEYKKSGEFDKLRRELLDEFEQGDAIDPFKARIESIARQRMSKDPEKFRDADPSVIQADMKKEVDRYPIIERAIGEIPSVRNETVARNVESSVQRVLKDLRVRLQTEESELPPSVSEQSPNRESTLMASRLDGPYESKEMQDQAVALDGPTDADLKTKDDRALPEQVSTNDPMPEQSSAVLETVN